MSDILIPQVEALQLVGEQTVSLAKGTLKLSGPLSQPDDSAGNAGPILAISIDDKVTFPLFQDTLFGTHAEEERWYSFQFKLPQPSSGGSSTSANIAGADSGPAPEPLASWIRLVLPADVSIKGAPVQRQRDDFEDRLIAAGLLQKGILAASDEISRSVQEGATTASAQIQALADRHVTTTEKGRNADVLRPSEGVHRAADQARDVTQQAREWTQSASNTVGGWVESAGAYVGTKVGDAKEALGLGQEGSSQTDAQATGQSTWEATKVAASDVGSSIATSASQLGSAASEQASRVLGHEAAHASDKGGHATVETASNVGNSIANVGGMAKDVTIGTSTIVHGAVAAKGAAAGTSEESTTTTTS